MPRDNNCLYHALAHFAGGTADATRKVICEETLKHPERRMGLDDDALEVEFSAYVENQSAEAGEARRGLSHGNQRVSRTVLSLIPAGCLGRILRSASLCGLLWPARQVSLFRREVCELYYPR